MPESPVPAPSRPDSGDSPPETKRILLVEDNQDYTMLITDALESRGEGYDVTSVGSPEAAMEALDREAFDLVLLDYKFPKGNGIEIIRRLKGMTPFTPAVMITAFGSEEVAIEAMREGALDFLPKTRDFLQALPTVIARVLDRSRIIRERMRNRQALERRNRELSVLNRISAILNRSFRLDRILEEALGQVLDLTSLEGGWVLLREGGDPMHVVASRGVEDEGGTQPELIEKLRCQVRDHGRACLRSGPSPADRRASDVSHLLIPLQAAGKVLGVIHLFGPLERSYPYSELELLTSIGKQVGVAVENARLYEELEHTKSYLEDLVENAGDSILTIGRDSRILTWNNGATVITGYTEAEMIGSPWHRLIPDNRRGETRDLMERVLAGETISNYETVRVHKDGTRLQLAITLSPLRDPEGNVTGISSLGKDVTRRKQLQEQLIQVEKLAAVGQLISGVAHELNNPLTAVIGYSQLIATAQTGEKKTSYLEKISTEAMRCQKIVQNLLTFAREHRPEKRLVGLNEVLRSTLELRDYEMRVRNIEVVQDLDPGLPSCQGDFHQLQQVFMNILTNAEHALRERKDGRIRVATESVQRPDGDLVRVVIEDNGPGIAPELHQKIFEPFFTTKALGHGTGLGLSLSYGVVRSHEGTIFVREPEEEGAGACFVIELPAQGAARRQASRERRQEDESLPPREAKVSRRILVVDDEPNVREMFQEVLSMCGHRIETAEDGDRALARIDEADGDYDLIITDMKMPRVGGRELYTRLCRRKPRMAERVIFSTGDVMNASTRSFLEKSGREVISKPCGAEEILEMVDRFFEQGHGQQAELGARA